ncbi:MAG: B12-binding domain-containing radical SAM protein [Candidatus Bathyarchaeota archaeon]|nr:B12-binding domain-containing radical SAM protein [Candidatus Bathyarchaeota archaeon]
MSILDQAARRFSAQQTLDWIAKEDPDILGFTVLSSASKEAGKIAGLAKTKNPNLWVVFGNYHPTLNAERVLEKYSAVDIVVKGEGEQTVVDLTRCLQNGGDLKQVAGVAYRDETGRIAATPERPMLKEVDSLPFPDRHLLSCEYASTIFGFRTATQKFTTILSSRGCPFQCTFCACRKFAKGLWRPRSVENVFKEMEFLYSEGYREFLFVDDNFTLDRRRVKKLCRLIREERLEINWFCDSRVDSCNVDILRGMAKAGCKAIYFGMESANQRILNYYRKHITPEQSKAAAQTAREAGIDIIVGSFIVGAPDETRSEIRNTLQFAQQTEIDLPSFNILGAPVGSAIWTELVAKGFVDEEEHWEEGVFVSDVVPTAVPFDEISRMIFEHFKAFYLSPKKLFSELFRTFGSPFRLGLLAANLARLGQNVKTLKQGVQFKGNKAFNFRTGEPLKEVFER